MGNAVGGRDGVSVGRLVGIADGLCRSKPCGGKDQPGQVARDCYVVISSPHTVYVPIPSSPPELTVVGLELGEREGEAVGARLGRDDGNTEGPRVGPVDGEELGSLDGETEGPELGADEGPLEGRELGSGVGGEVGLTDGIEEGNPEGPGEGAEVGAALGRGVGICVTKEKATRFTHVWLTEKRHPSYGSVVGKNLTPYTRRGLRGRLGGRPAGNPRGQSTWAYGRGDAWPLQNRGTNIKIIKSV